MKSEVPGLHLGYLCLGGSFQQWSKRSDSFKEQTSTYALHLQHGLKQLDIFVPVYN